MKSIILATRNKHKFSEIDAFLKNHNLEIALTSLLDHPNLPEIEEDCLSFAGNSLKKAKTISLVTNSPVLADDSGLMVDALDGRPGVFSARYAGVGATDDQNNQKLHQELVMVSKANRAARFVCSMVLYLPNGTFFTSQGELKGTMVDDFRGEHGFGYDPMFYMPHRKCTLAEVPEDEKIQFSHRTRALESLLKITNNLKA